MPIGIIIFKGLKVLRIRIGFVLPTLRLKFLMRLQHCPYGAGLRVCGPVHVRASGSRSVVVGDAVTLMARYLTNSAGFPAPIMIECFRNGRVEIGSSSGLTSAVLSARTLIQIGNHVNIGANARIYDHDFHSLDFRDRRSSRLDREAVKTAPVIIGDDCFIGTGSIILKGVNIGARSIVAAGSVVSLKEIPPDSLVGGNPARIIKRDINGASAQAR